MQFANGSAEGKTNGMAEFSGPKPIQTKSLLQGSASPNHLIVNGNGWDYNQRIAASMGINPTNGQSQSTVDEKLKLAMAGQLSD